MSFSHCDINTGRIYGCSPNTFEWFHEEGHFVYNSKEETSRLIMINSFVFDFWMTFTTLGLLAFYVLPKVLKLDFILIILSTITLLVYAYLNSHEERWCNNYARTKLNELRLKK